jgi:hypothetical protein
VSEVIDLTGDFVPQSTSTQAPASAVPKPRTRLEAKAKASNHASSTPWRDKVIKMPAERIVKSGNITMSSPIESSFLSASEAIDVFAAPVAGPSTAATRRQTRPTRTSNVTTPASSNPSKALRSATTAEQLDSKLNPKNRHGQTEAVVKGKAKETKKTKEKPRLVTPLEYAQKLQETLQTTLPGQKKSTKDTNYLKGKHIFYIGGDMQYAGARTRGRMDFVGPPAFFSAATHVV